jgi:hypothetical protein
VARPRRDLSNERDVMSTTSVKRAPARRAPATRRPTRRRESNRILWVLVVVAIVVGAAAVAAVASHSKNTASEQPASTALVHRVASVPTSVFDAVGAGTATAAPRAIDAPALTAAGKPEILYLGAEYCPFCATERWPMVVALARFGTFSNLKTTQSSALDQFPNTHTFSFHGASYSSPWIAFTGVEMESNRQQGDGYAPLEQPTAEQQRLLNTYDRSPYLGANASAGGIPFVDFGGKFLVSGATYFAGVLQGKSLDAIAQALSDPTNPVAKGAIGAANTFTAAICTLTHDRPATVCSDPVIRRIQASG